jgi:hypothetical protein
MRRLPLTLLISLCCLTAATGQEVVQGPIPWANKIFTGAKDDPPPVILHDFGTLPKGAVRTYKFPMTNIYAVPMHVRLAKTPSCSCVTVVEHTGSMKPRETGHVEVLIDTSKVDGPKSVRVPVTLEGRDPVTQEKFFSTAQLEVRAISQPDIAINPGAIAFGEVPAGQKAVQSLTIVYSGRQSGWGITGLEYKKDLLDVAAHPVEIRGARAAYRVTASLKATAPPGLVEETIVLKTNDPSTAAVTVRVTGSVQAPLGLRGTDKDGLLRFGKVEVDKKAERRITVESIKPFKIAKIDGEGDGVSVFAAQGPELKIQVVIVSVQPKKPGNLTKELKIHTSTGESVPLTVEALGIEPQQ